MTEEGAARFLRLSILYPSANSLCANAFGAYATLAGLPPAFIAVGALDLFVDEDIDYAARLIRK